MMLEAQALRYDYAGGIEALRGLDLAVGRGRRLALLGPNGCGKTTLFLHLNGTLKPRGGRVMRDGSPAGYDRRALRDWRNRVALVLQDPDDQIFAATVARDVAFGPLNLDLPEAEVRRRVTAALADLGIGDLADRPTHMLSFGQKRRVAIAGALAMRPEVLLLDEPTAGLDADGVIRLMAVLDGLAAQGMTLVLSTHDVDLAYAWADDIAILFEGRTLIQGTAPDVLGDAEALARARLRPPLLLELARAMKLPRPWPRTREAMLGSCAGG
ncbi:energy-coupling factor ABC transporter ATP-binding protein [Skermanella pratensis]|uniref:energy-coupling factor ABC transporter ATP-binding protein n=1 Tax=Skermanella pratensis TaxID=2233999 RepID=UPI0013015D7C|nr:ATP-binding cassette domain-containing protein [Skermanella pratensis]